MAAAEPVLVAIGDVHGRADLLRALLGRIAETMGTRAYRLVLLGDYVDRGPDSRGVLDTLLRLKRERPDTVFLKGNHEQAMLDFLGAPEEGEAWVQWGGAETLESYGVRATEPAPPGADDLKMERPAAVLAEELAGALPDEHFAFLMGLDLTHRAGRHLFVHAGLNPERALDDQRERDLLWIREAFSRHGKGAFGDLVVVHGHTPTAKPENKSWRVNVDTGAVWSGRLTAVILDGDKRRFVAT